MKNRTIYISGRVTGLPYWWAWIRFKIAKLYLFLRGYDVIEPIDIVPYVSTWDEAMEICLDAMDEADTIYLLSNWKKSKGAKQELKKAI
ncbi:MAG: DUF4406 domain-containing protein [Saprospiraceae bacterium]|nr:DUF4406 domain-containing protein [Saprospiraceae bacterium]